MEPWVDHHVPKDLQDAISAVADHLGGHCDLLDSLLKSIASDAIECAEVALAHTSATYREQAHALARVEEWFAAHLRR